jgi:hypothetical protein
MRVKLCERCPYTPRDLAGHYDPNGLLHACAKCDGQQGASTNHYPRKAHRRQQCTTVPNIFVTAQPSVARSVTEGLVLSGTIPGEPLSVQRSAPIASGLAGRATTNGYADFMPPDSGRSERHAAIPRRLEFRSKEDAK